MICKDTNEYSDCIDGKRAIKGATIRVEARMKEEAGGDGEPASPGIRKFKRYYRFRLDEKANPKRIVLIDGDVERSSGLLAACSRGWR